MEQHSAMMTTTMMMIAKTMDAPDSLTHSLLGRSVGRCVPLARFWHDEKSSSTRRTPYHESTTAKDRVVLRKEFHEHSFLVYGCVPGGA